MPQHSRLPQTRALASALAVAATSAVTFTLLGGTLAANATAGDSSHSAPHHHPSPMSDLSPADYQGEDTPRQRGRFIIHCQPTVRDVVDPIVTPGTYGRSHSHDFYGPRTLDTHPSTRQIVATLSESSCSDPADRSTYWHPTLYRDGKEIRPQRAQAYYHVTEKSQPFPAGLTYIVGSPGTTVTDGVRARWVCGGDGNSVVTRVAVPCEEDQYVMAAVSFPGCWNGRDLVSENYISHMAYADVQGRCPRSHPVHVPQLDLFVQWDCSAVCGSVGGLSLSSGSTGGWHGDAIFHWPRPHLGALIEKCSNKDCGVIGEVPLAPTALTPASVTPQTLLWPQLAAYRYLSDAG